jgi:hypothetical protein
MAIVGDTINTIIACRYGLRGGKPNTILEQPLDHALAEVEIPEWCPLPEATETATNEKLMPIHETGIKYRYSVNANLGLGDIPRHIANLAEHAMQMAIRKVAVVALRYDTQEYLSGGGILDNGGILEILTEKQGEEYRACVSIIEGLITHDWVGEVDENLSLIADGYLTYATDRISDVIMQLCIEKVADKI